MNRPLTQLEKEQAAERALARAMEYDRINATEKDEWYYMQGDDQFGPVPLKELKEKVADLTLVPPIAFAWHEGMEAWRPVHEVSHICGVSPLAATQYFKIVQPPRVPGAQG